jgi:hypothetical protein
MNEERSGFIRLVNKKTKNQSNDINCLFSLTQYV